MRYNTGKPPNGDKKCKQIYAFFPYNALACEKNLTKNKFHAIPDNLTLITGCKFLILRPNRCNNDVKFMDARSFSILQFGNTCTFYLSQAAFFADIFLILKP